MCGRGTLPGRSTLMADCTSNFCNFNSRYSVGPKVTALSLRLAFTMLIPALDGSRSIILLGQLPMDDVLTIAEIEANSTPSGY